MKTSEKQFDQFKAARSPMTLHRWEFIQILIDLPNFDWLLFIWFVGRLDVKPFIGRYINRYHYKFTWRVRRMFEMIYNLILRWERRFFFFPLSSSRDSLLNQINQNSASSVRLSFSGSLGHIEKIIVRETLERNSAPADFAPVVELFLVCNLERMAILVKKESIEFTRRRSISTWRTAV